MKLDRQFIASQNENTLLKQRLNGYESNEKDLQQSRSQLQFFEHQVQDFQNENNQLRFKIQLLQERFQSDSAFPDYPRYDINPVSHPSSQLHLPSPPPTASQQFRISSFQAPHGSGSYRLYDEDQRQTSVSERKFPKSLSTTLNDTYDNRYPGPLTREINEASQVRRSETSLANVINASYTNSNSAISRRNITSSGGVPFATDETSYRLMKEFDQMERDLTNLMTEKNTLQEESERSVLLVLFLISDDLF
jgi:regulator of replication initiation timing